MNTFNQANIGEASNLCNNRDAQSEALRELTLSLERFLEWARAGLDRDTVLSVFPPSPDRADRAPACEADPDLSDALDRAGLSLDSSMRALLVQIVNHYGHLEVTPTKSGLKIELASSMPYAIELESSSLGGLKVLVRLYTGTLAPDGESHEPGGEFVLSARLVLASDHPNLGDHLRHFLDPYFRLPSEAAVAA